MAFSKDDTLASRPGFIKKFVKSYGATENDILAADATETAASNKVAHQGWTIPAGGNGNPNAMRETIIAMGIGSDIGSDDDEKLGAGPGGPVYGQIEGLFKHQGHQIFYVGNASTMGPSDWTLGSVSGETRPNAGDVGFYDAYRAYMDAIPASTAYSGHSWAGGSSSNNDSWYEWHNLGSYSWQDPMNYFKCLLWSDIDTATPTLWTNQAGPTFLSINHSGLNSNFLRLTCTVGNTWDYGGSYMTGYSWKNSNTGLGGYTFQNGQVGQSGYDAWAGASNLGISFLSFDGYDNTGNPTYEAIGGQGWDSSRALGTTNNAFYKVKKAGS